MLHLLVKSGHDPNTLGIQKRNHEGIDKEIMWDNNSNESFSYISVK